MSAAPPPDPVASRLAASSERADRSGRFEPRMKEMPSIPPVDGSAVEASPPTPLEAPANELPPADAVVVTWAESEWAALDHVFLARDRPLEYADRGRDHWPGWRTYDRGMPDYDGPDAGSWTRWGRYRLVEVAGRRVLLFKSNTHLDWPGRKYLEAMVARLARRVRPELLLSVGTAGGARTDDHVGAVNVVAAGTLRDAHAPREEWPVWRSDYRPPWSVVEDPGFGEMLFPVPADRDRLERLAKQFDAHYGTDYPLAKLDPEGLNVARPEPALNDLVPGDVSLLTTASFVVGTDDGRFDEFACIEMDDAVVGEVCDRNGVAFGFVRNVSDPVQNADLPEEVQGNWGGAVYDVFGMYTSYNGALVAWAMLAGG